MRQIIHPIFHCGTEMFAADQSMTGYWPYIPHRCSRCGAIEYARMEEVEPYDSAADTWRHIGRVRALLLQIESELVLRGAVHDASKLQSPEKEVYDRLTPLKRKTQYGSTEYKRIMDEMGDIPGYHYAHNRHHPEHFAGGINEMSLMDIIEMLCDWKAASEDYSNGNLAASIQLNIERFGISEQMGRVLSNTARDLDWL